LANTIKKAPIMISEVIEAIHLMYEDYPDVELDCMLFLKGLSGEHGRIRTAVDQWFIDHGRCEICGSKLQSYTYQEPHPELDGCPMETLSDELCPVCERGDID